MPQTIKKMVLIFFLSIATNIALANERFIPLELWSGGEITGSKDITFPKTNFKFGYKKKHSINGPIDWKNLRSGETIVVYERSRFSRKAGKLVKQLWTVTNNNQCLGRVFDNRRDRFIKNGCKFPLGTWKQDESRSFVSDYYDSERGTYQRVKTIKILELGKDDKSCLKFRWILTQEGSTLDDNTYEYCHKKGLVKLNGKRKF